MRPSSIARRHPMYTGGLIVCIGSAIVAGGGFVFLLIVLSSVFLRRVLAEDRLMAAFPGTPSPLTFGYLAARHMRDQN